MEGEPRKRAKQLTRKIASSPVLPLLGITKAVETVIAGGPTGRWLEDAFMSNLRDYHENDD